MLGMQVAGIDPYPMRNKLIESAKELMKRDSVENSFKENEYV